MNDEWSRCPICFEDYSLEHRPTTFVCGHSTCIDHTSGSSRLKYCPICRHPLGQEIQHHISYNLEEASRLFQVIKNSIDWSKIKLPSAPVVSHDQNDTLEMIHRDTIYARRLQTELNRETVNETPQRNMTLQGELMPALSSVLQRVGSSSHQKRCGHACDLVSTRQCCECSDKRPRRPNNRYQTYVDGVGIVDQVPRNEYYCSTCKRR